MAGPVRPHMPPPGRSPAAHLVRAEVIDIRHIRIPAAALGRMGIDHVVYQVQRVRLSIGRHELGRRHEVFAIGEVKASQPAVPRSSVDDVVTRIARGADDRRRGHPSGTEQVGRTRSGVRLPVSVELPGPEQFAPLHIDGKEVVRDPRDQRDFLPALRRGHVFRDEGGKQRVHLPGFVVELDLPEQLGLVNVTQREDRLVLLPGGSLRIAAVGQPVRPGRGNAAEHKRNQQFLNSHVVASRRTILVRGDMIGPLRLFPFQ